MGFPYRGLREFRTSAPTVPQETAGAGEMVLFSNTICEELKWKRTRASEFP